MAKKTKLQPILQSDAPHVRKEIQTLLDRGYPVVRHSVHQLKIGSISYYPGKGTIMEDPHYVRSEKGLEALLDLIESIKRQTIILSVN